MTEENQPTEDQSLTLWQIIGSTAAAAFGVQTNANRARDFAHGRIGYFVAAGILFTALFVLTLVALVKMILNVAG